MKTKQYSLSVLEVVLTDKDEFISFFEKNYLIFKNHLISINGNEDDEIKNYLDSKKLVYTFNKDLPKKQVKQKQPLQQHIEQKKDLKVVDKLVRSGQELNVDGDLLLLNRVNSGGSVITNGTLIITQLVDGSIRCNGNFMMLKASNKANIVFHGLEIDNNLLQGRLNRIELVNEDIRITPALKEQNWV